MRRRPFYLLPKACSQLFTCFPNLITKQLVPRTSVISSSPIPYALSFQRPGFQGRINQEEYLHPNVLVECFTFWVELLKRKVHPCYRREQHLVCYAYVLWLRTTLKSCLITGHDNVTNFSRANDTSASPFKMSAFL